MLTLPEAWTEVGEDYTRWVLVFVGFAVVALAVWAVDLWRVRRRPARR